MIAISRDGSYLILLSRPSADHAGLEHGIRSPLGICGADPILRINGLSLSACDLDQEPPSEAQRDPVPPNKANQGCVLGLKQRSREIYVLGRVRIGQGNLPRRAQMPAKNAHSEPF